MKKVDGKNLNMIVGGGNCVCWDTRRGRGVTTSEYNLPAVGDCRHRCCVITGSPQVWFEHNGKRHEC